MARKLSLLLAFAALACAVVVPSAAASGLGAQRVVAPGDGPTASRAATASPLIAPASICPGQTGLNATAAAQEQAMRCMTNFARARAGLGELAEAAQLDQSARGKSEDVLRCNSFSHFACGREFTYWIRASGYIGAGCWHAGENLAWGTREYGSVRAIFQAWMNSPGHRRNILGEYEEVGISVETGNLEGHRGAQVWAAHFGSRCEG